MNTLTELDKLASSLLQKLPELMQAGTVYANDLTHRFVIYSIIKESITVTALSILVILYVVLTVKWFKWARKKDNGNRYSDCTTGWVCGNLVLICMVILPCLVLLSHSVWSILQAIYLPELLIINYFK